MIGSIQVCSYDVVESPSLLNSSLDVVELLTAGTAACILSSIALDRHILQAASILRYDER